MANNSLFNSFNRISSFAQHDDSQARLSPAVHDLFSTDRDVPLDAFDKELLAECLPEPTQMPEHIQTRISLPPRRIQAQASGVDDTRMLRDHLYSTPAPSHRSSSSSTLAASSPTVLALQNRHHFHTFGSNLTSTTRTGGAGSFREHTGEIVTPELEWYPHSSQVRSKACIQPRTVSTAKTQGGATRMGLGHAPPIIQGIPLIATTELPDRYRSIFPFPVFNAVQSKCFAVAFGSDENLVVSAPTGSGKTAVMELAICQLMMARSDGDFKVVYQAPTKSLCAERMRDWTRKFASLDLSCAELTGDTEQAQLKNVQSASIIITTPEKWDSVTRKWKDNARLMKLVKLFLIDEVHILKEMRGATLEAVVSRMKSVDSEVRFVTLSATVPNSDDIATWLGKCPNAQHLPAHRHVFGEEFRPVKLEKHVWGIRGSANDFAFDRVLDESVKQAIATYSRRKPTMIFCTTRKMAVDTAKMLADLFRASEKSHRLWPAPNKDYRILDQELSNLVTAGVAFHHGGVDAADRRSVEEGFLSSDISIICCTSTLAVGVNLPCYLVVIKGTVAWTDKGTQEYPDLEIMQMLGRAGRPQFETSACAVILTRPERELHYKKMVSGEEILESCLHLNLLDHLNSEIGLGTVNDIRSAKKWLAGTFMFVRLQRNPKHYQLDHEVNRTGTEELLERICVKDISLLQEAHLVTEGSTFRCTEFGDAMARYFVSFNTMKTILAMAPRAKMSEVLSTLAQASEFSDVRFKSGEKGFYKELNGDIGIKFPIKVDVAQNLHKVSLLIQSELGGSIFPSDDKWKKHKSQFHIDKNMVFSHVNRLIRCTIDCQLQKDDAVSVRHSLELARSLAARVWDKSAFQMKQIDLIGEAGVRRLAQAGINSVETLQNTEPHRIEHALRRNPPFGQMILAKAAEFPSLRVSVKQVGKECSLGQWVKVNFKVDIGFLNEKFPLVFRKRAVYVCFMAETSHGELIDFRRFAARKLQNGQEIHLSVQLTKPTTSVNCHVMCDEVAGSERRAELVLEQFPASYFPTPEPTTSEPPRTEANTKVVSIDPREFDDFSDIDDADLLAALDNEEGIEVIHDIDKFFEDSKALEKRPLKRKASKIAADHEDDPPPFKEPVQLENGRWTCQHPCKEQGKTCQHRCCTEGVKIPAKTVRKKASKKDATSQYTQDVRASDSSAKTSPFEKPRLQSAAKKEKATATSTQKGHKSNLLRKTKSEVASSPLFKTPAPRYEKDRALKLSFMQNPLGFSNSVNEFVETQKDDNDDVFDFDMDDEENLLVERGFTKPYQSDGQPLQRLASRPNQTPVQTLPEQRESNGITSQQTSAAQRLGVSTNADDFSPAEINGSHYGPTGTPETKLTAIDIEIQDPDLSVTEPCNEAYFGAFHAPLAHVAPAVIQRRVSTAPTSSFPATSVPQAKQKGLSITSESSSSEQSLQNPTGAIPGEEYFMDSGLEALFAKIESANYKPSPPPVKKQKVDQETRTDSLLPPSNALIDLTSSTAKTTPSFGDQEIWRRPLATLQNDPVRRQVVVKSRMDERVRGEPFETREERQERLADQEQKKKWVGSEDFYEEFGEFVEVI